MICVWIASGAAGRVPWCRVAAHHPRRRRRFRHRQDHAHPRDRPPARQRPRRPRLPRRLPPPRPAAAPRPRHHPAAPRLQLHGRDGAASAAAPRRRGDPEARLPARRRHVRPAGLPRAGAVRDRRGAARLLERGAARLLRRARLPRSAGEPAPPLEGGAGTARAAATPPARCWRSSTAASRTPSPTSARSATTRTWSCASARRPGEDESDAVAPRRAPAAAARSCPTRISPTWSASRTSG